MMWLRWRGMGNCTSEPTNPPTADFADPMVWFQLPSERLGSSFVIAPEEEAE